MRSRRARRRYSHRPPQDNPRQLTVSLPPRACRPRPRPRRPRRPPPRLTTRASSPPPTSRPTLSLKAASPSKLCLHQDQTKHFQAPPASKPSRVTTWLRAISYPPRTPRCTTRRLPLWPRRPRRRRPLQARTWCSRPAPTSSTRRRRRTSWGRCTPSPPGRTCTPPLLATTCPRHHRRQRPRRCTTRRRRTPRPASRASPHSTSTW